MQLSRWKVLGGLVVAAVLSMPAFAAEPALPGTLNYVEGQASAGNQALNAKSVGSVNLDAGETLTTQAGKAEILLTPGVFFRVGANSSAQMVSSSLTNTKVRLDKGRALVEVAEIHKQNDLRIAADGATTQLLKDGLYSFNADNGQVQVFKGEALVQDGDQHVKVKSGREVDVNNTAKLQAQKFKKDSYEQSDLYRFSSLRSEYEAEANAQAATVYYDGGPGWFGPGWYWSPWFSAYTWIPGDGILYSPFGWGFYSPAWAYAAPIYYGGYYPYYGRARGPYARGGVAQPRMSAAAPRVSPRMTAPAMHASTGHFGVMGGGFHGGMSGGFHGGGFHR